MATPLEIERKWMVHSWPNDLPLLEELEMAQGYVSTKPTVRIRSGRGHGEEKYILCFKSKSLDGGLSRKELELPLEKEEFRRLEEFIGLPLIQKLRRTGTGSKSVMSTKDSLRNSGMRKSNFRQLQKQQHGSLPPQDWKSISFQK